MNFWADKVNEHHFGTSSMYNWSKSVAEIYQQLYTKYGLKQSEIDFVESKIKPME